MWTASAEGAAAATAERQAVGVSVSAAEGGAVRVVLSVLPARRRGSTVLGQLRDFLAKGQKDNAAYGQLERKYETLTNDMRTLQGQLADYNLLLDRSRAHREVEEVLQEVTHLTNQNQTDRSAVDEVFAQCFKDTRPFDDIP